MTLGRTEENYGNWFNRAAQDLREKGQEVAPIFDAKGGKMWSDTYWLNQFANIGTTAGIVGEGIAEVL